MIHELERSRIAKFLGISETMFDPWATADDDLIILKAMRRMEPEVFGAYKDALYHETRGHGTHNVWEYNKGKFANAWIMWANSATRDIGIGSGLGSGIVKRGTSESCGLAIVERSSHSGRKP